MWDEQDNFSRWVQGVFAVILAIGVVGGIYMAMHATLTMLIFGGIAATFGCIRIGWRCAHYAITGPQQYQPG
jgi:hypothetical protein